MGTTKNKEKVFKHVVRFQGEVKEVKMVKSLSNDKEYSCKIIGGNKELMRLDKVPEDTVIDVVIGW